MHPSYSAVAIECSLHNVVHCCKSLHSTVQCQILQYSAQLTLCTVHFSQRSAVQCCVAWRDQYWGIHYNDISVSHYNDTPLLFTAVQYRALIEKIKECGWNVICIEILLLLINLIDHHEQNAYSYDDPHHHLRCHGHQHHHGIHPK